MVLLLWNLLKPPQLDVIVTVTMFLLVNVKLCAEHLPAELLSFSVQF